MFITNQRCLELEPIHLNLFKSDGMERQIFVGFFVCRFDLERRSSQRQRQEQEEQERR